MRKKVIISCILVCLLLSACSVFTKELTIHQTPDQIQTVELVVNKTNLEENGTKEVVYTLTDSEIEPFVQSLLSLKYHKHTSPRGTYGYMFIVITYSNGAVERIGASANSYTSDTLEFDGWYYVSYDQLRELFLNYVDESVLPSF